MTPGQIIDAARRAFNAQSSDTFYSDAQMYDWIHSAEMELATKAKVIKGVFTTTTVSGTQDYAYPTNAIGIMRVTYDGQALDDLSFREDDIITGNNSASTSRGTPAGFVAFNDTLSLRPIPGSAVALKVWAWLKPSGVPTSSYVMEIPVTYHIQVVDYLVSRMCSKSKDYDGAEFYQAKWDRQVQGAVSYEEMRLRGNKLPIVANVDYAIW
jgi:hypothetical protein